jgi:hypothetical protein
MPDLKDTELRLLLTLTRATVGWNRENRSVIMSYRTLTRKTGRSSEALAKAVASLRTRGLIHTPRASKHDPIRLADEDPLESEQRHIKTDR